jgi:hypothetical protein
VKTIDKEVLRQRTNDYHRSDWTWVVGPKFSRKDRAPSISVVTIPCSRSNTLAGLSSDAISPSISSMSVPAISGLFRLTADKLSPMFGFRLHKRLRGKLATVLEKMKHGHHVLRACGKNAGLRMYEKFSTFLCLEVLSNNLRDFGLNKSLENLESVRQTLAAVTDRFAEFEAHALDTSTCLSPCDKRRSSCLSCSFSSINASADPWPIAFSIANPPKPTRLKS